MAHEMRLESEGPVAAGLLCGFGLERFFDGLRRQQGLQEHPLLTSTGYPPDRGQPLEVNTLWDGLWPLSTSLVIVLGLLILGRAARRTPVRWSGPLRAGTLGMGCGLLHSVDGVRDRHLLGIHPANETVPPDPWLSGDRGFLGGGR